MQQKKISELNRVYVDSIIQFNSRESFLAGSYSLRGLIDSWLEVEKHIDCPQMARVAVNQIMQILFSKYEETENQKPSFLHRKKPFTSTDIKRYTHLITSLLCQTKYVEFVVNKDFCDGYDYFCLLKGHQVNWEYAKLAGVALSKADLSEAKLLGADLSRSVLDGVNLSRANLMETNLAESNLSHAVLTKIISYRTEFTDANLKGCDLTGADLYGANLVRADLTDAILTNAILSEAVVDQAKFSKKSLATATLTDEQRKWIIVVDEQRGL